MTQIKYITIKEAAELTERSIQTIRRMIKSKKIRYRKDKTAQGFNYLIEHDSIADLLNVPTQDSSVMQEIPHEEPAQPAKQAEIPIPTQALATTQKQVVSYEPVKEFNETLQKLIEQHGKEKENLFKLIETFQNKVISLENKLKVESVVKKSWFKLW